MEASTLQLHTLDRKQRLLQAMWERCKERDGSMFDREPLKGEMDRISKDTTKLKPTPSGCASWTKGETRTNRHPRRAMDISSRMCRGMGVVCEIGSDRRGGMEGQAGSQGNKRDGHIRKQWMEARCLPSQ